MVNLTRSSGLAVLNKDASILALDPQIVTFEAWVWSGLIVARQSGATTAQFPERALRRRREMGKKKKKNKKKEPDWIDKTTGRLARAAVAKLTWGASEIVGAGEPISNFVAEQSRKGEERYQKLSPEEKREVDFWRSRMMTM
ncbi:hypothetical protein [Streptomyces griseorubiginosus]|uniref:hypothetical protein n=1 Tax=Streptomyces griseorubiginosus TaxID=67304 RepID=UPI0036E2D104